MIVQAKDNDEASADWGFSRIPTLCGLHVNRDASVNHEATHPLPHKCVPSTVTIPVSSIYPTYKSANG